jgi:hypothetical protein
MTRWLAAAALLGLFLSTACAARSTAPSLSDAETAVRVKTALVNHPVLGIEDVRVDVRQGVAHLTGRISAAGREPEIVALVRAVPGITAVTANLTVAPHVGAAQSRLGVLPERMRERRGRLIAAGAGVRVVRAAGRDVDDGMNVAPFIRLGSGDGFGPAIGFGWNRRDLLASPTGDPALASLRVRPVMGGVAYTRTVASRYQVSGSLVGGYAFTHLGVDRQAAGPWRAIDVENTFAWRPSATLWIDPGGRLSYQVSAGYLVARPRVTYASDTGLTAARVRGDALMVTVGAAWWVF